MEEQSTDWKLMASVCFYEAKSEDSSVYVIMSNGEHKLITEAKLSKDAARLLYWANLKMLDGAQ